jgi:uncharacterized protein (DUF2384 family)
MPKSKIHTTKKYKPAHKGVSVQVIPSPVNEPLVGLKENIHSYKKDTLTGAIEHLYGKRSHSNSIFDKLFKDTRLPVKTLAEQVFEVTPKTLNTYRITGKNIPMHVRELSIKLSGLYAKGNRVFGSTDNFNDWLKKKSYGLGGMKPIELLNTVTGIEMISDELVSIEFGTTA